jgi:hypothetical protein
MSDATTPSTELDLMAVKRRLSIVQTYQSVPLLPARTKLLSEDIPALIAEVERLRKEIADMEEARAEAVLDAWGDNFDRGL